MLQWSDARSTVPPGTAVLGGGPFVPEPLEREEDVHAEAGVVDAGWVLGVIAVEEDCGGGSLRTAHPVRDADDVAGSRRGESGVRLQGVVAQQRFEAVAQAGRDPGGPAAGIDGVVRDEVFDSGI